METPDRPTYCPLIFGRNRQFQERLNRKFSMRAPLSGFAGSLPTLRPLPGQPGRLCGLLSAASAIPFLLRFRSERMKRVSTWSHLPASWAETSLICGELRPCRGLGTARCRFKAVTHVENSDQTLHNRSDSVKPRFLYPNRGLHFGSASARVDIRPRREARSCPQNEFFQDDGKQGGC